VRSAVFASAFICSLLALGSIGAGVLFSVQQQRQRGPRAQEAATRFRFAMIGGVVFSLISSGLWFSTIV
jgi:hypothetical protein